MSGEQSYTSVQISAPAWRYYVHLRLSPPGLCIRQAHKRIKRLARVNGWRWPGIAGIKTLENRHGLARGADEPTRRQWDEAERGAPSARPQDGRRVA